MMQFILGSLGLLLIIEGLLYALFPNRMKNMIRSMLEMNNDTLKWGGLASAIVGFLMLWTAVR
ncbi:MAG: hypothetical protein CM15mP16_08800 [Candidatus Pelagibacterales bacterium]|jgi:uncharacterized protein YjeT (DUF2065 family)|nr:MAG: hypothetical protein CM15mP16_08800 [Pelagibacterales bacterium]